MIVLNKKLLQQQGIDSESEMGIRATHTVLELILDNPELVGIDSASEVVRGLEFALQKLWNFPQDENFHRYQFMIKGCECPKMDNEDMFRSGQPYRYYNMECPIHYAVTKKTEASETKQSSPPPPPTPPPIRSLREGEYDEKIEFMKNFLKMLSK